MLGPRLPPGDQPVVAAPPAGAEELNRWSTRKGGIVSTRCNKLARADGWAPVL